jgi:hypothetical protein
LGAWLVFLTTSLFLSRAGIANDMIVPEDWLNAGLRTKLTDD